MLSLLGFIFSIGLVFEIIRIIRLVFEIVYDLFRRVYPYHCDFLEVAYKTPNDFFCISQIMIIIIQIICRNCIVFIWG